MVRGREVGLLATVRDRNDVGGFVDTTLELALVASRCWVRVRWVEPRVSGLSKGGIATVRAINGIQEVVEEALEDVVVLVDWVIRLEQNCVLRVDDWVRDLEVQVRLGSCLREVCLWSDGTVDQVKLRLRALWNISSLLSVPLIALIDKATLTEQSS